LMNPKESWQLGGGAEGLMVSPVNVEELSIEADVEAEEETSDTEEDGERVEVD